MKRKQSRNRRRVRARFPRWRKALKVTAVTFGAVIILTAATTVWGALRVHPERASTEHAVNDVSGLNRTFVSRVLVPETTAEIVDAVREHPGPIAIGGGRYSMGGQTASDAALHIDMRRFNGILAFDSVGRTIRVQAGTRWRQIQEHIDPAGLSVKVMQTYANFTVGGSLSVNAHGRYMGLGPLILSVRSFEIVLPDGRVVEASPSENSEIFYGAIGGYGGLGVITEVTLTLTDNIRVRREHHRHALRDYARWFGEQIRPADDVIFHNADIYPDEYDRVNAVSFVATHDSVTIEERLIPPDRSYRLHRFVFWIMSEWPFGKEIREHIVDPLVFRDNPVTWRNYEASYDVAELEPRSRVRQTYVLQEYFVPVARFDEFVPKMRDIFRRRNVNVLNVSVRHATPDPGSLLAWAREEVFSFVVYYKQGTGATARAEVEAWTRELIDAALAVGGTYYLPYQPHATYEQFLSAYPRATEFFALKQQLDPSFRFRNQMWDRYYGRWLGWPEAGLAPEARARLDSLPGYRRPESQAYLAHPEWSIVYSFHEFADWTRDRLPTGFPYAKASGQFWVEYRQARRMTRREYPPNAPYQVMLGVIGTSYAVELTLKGLYENTLGRLSGWTSGGRLSDEDRFAHRVAQEYADFVHVRPWYEYEFGSKAMSLWGDLPWWGEYPVRKWERKLLLTLEYGIKAAYAGVIELATRASYAYPDETRQLVVRGWTDSLGVAHPKITALTTVDTLHTVLGTGQFDEFREALFGLARSRARVEIVELSGNDDVLITGLAPRAWSHSGGRSEVLHATPLVSDSGRKRVLVRARASRLLEAIRELETGGLAIDHIYDY